MYGFLSPAFWISLIMKGKVLSHFNEIFYQLYLYWSIMKVVFFIKETQFYNSADAKYVSQTTKFMYSVYYGTIDSTCFPINCQTLRWILLEILFLCVSFLQHARPKARYEELCLLQDVLLGVGE